MLKTCIKGMILCSLFPLVAGCTAAAHLPKYTDPYTFDQRPQHPEARFLSLWRKSPPGLTPFGSFPVQFAGVTYLPSSDTVVVANMAGEVQKFQGANGDLLWQKEFPYTFSATPAIFRQNIYLPTLQGVMLAINADNGREIWQAVAENSLEGTPAVNREVVLALDSEDILYCWNADDGSLRWRFENERSKNFTIKGAATPILTENHAIVGFAGGELSAFDLHSGKKLWTLDLSGGETEFSDVDLLQTTSDGTIIAASRAGGVAAVDPNSGRVLWRAPYPSISALKVTPHLVLIATTTQRVIALNAKNGTPLWSFKTKDAVATSIQTYGHYVVVATGQGPLYVLDDANGFPHQRWDGLRGVHAPLTYGGQRLYLHDDSGEVHALKLGW